MPLATVPLQDGARAAEVLREAHGGGLPRRDDRHAAEGRRRRARRSRRSIRSGRRPTSSARWCTSIRCSTAATAAVNDYGLANAVGRITDTLIAGLAAIYSGHILRYTQCEVHRRHRRRGAALRAGPAAHATMRSTRQVGDPDAALRRSTTIPSCTTRGCCDFSSRWSAPDRMMLGSDMPFPIGDPSRGRSWPQAGFKPDQVESRSRAGSARSCSDRIDDDNGGSMESMTDRCPGLSLWPRQRLLAVSAGRSRGQALEKLTIVIFGAAVARRVPAAGDQGAEVRREERPRHHLRGAPPDAYTAQFNSGEFKVGGSASLTDASASPTCAASRSGTCSTCSTSGARSSPRAPRSRR